MTINEVKKIRELKRMGDSAAQQAARSLSGMIGEEVNMAVSAVNIISLDNVPRLIGMANGKAVIGSFVHFTGNSQGTVLNLFSIETAKQLADIMLMGMEDTPAEGQVLGEMSQSAIMELSNVITSSFVDKLANTLCEALNQSPPSFACDFMESLLEGSLLLASEQGDFALMFDCQFDVVNMDIDMEIIVFPDVDTIQKIFDCLPV